jgi:hypothetical protein
MTAQEIAIKHEQNMIIVRSSSSKKQIRISPMSLRRYYSIQHFLLGAMSQLFSFSR